MVEMQQIEKEASIPGIFILSFTMENLQNKEQEGVKKAKSFRGTLTNWKYSMCLQPICKGQIGGVSYWELAHRQIAK